MSVPAMQVYPGTYRDSLLLLSATRAMADGPGVSWAGAVMATPGTVEDLTGQGFPPGDPALAANLRAAALATAQRFTWAQSAAEHQAIYASIARM